MALSSKFVILCGNCWKGFEGDEDVRLPSLEHLRCPTCKRVGSLEYIHKRDQNQDICLPQKRNLTKAKAMNNSSGEWKHRAIKNRTTRNPKRHALPTLPQVKNQTHKESFYSKASQSQKRSRFNKTNECYSSPPEEPEDSPSAPCTQRMGDQR